MRSLHEIAKVAVKIYYRESAFISNDISFEMAQKKAARANPTIAKHINRLTVEDITYVRENDEHRIQESTKEARPI